MSVRQLVLECGVLRPDASALLSGPLRYAFDVMARGRRALSLAGAKPARVSAILYRLLP
jgi:hypothetical protein